MKIQWQVISSATRTLKGFGSAMTLPKSPSSFANIITTWACFVAFGPKSAEHLTRATACVRTTCGLHARPGPPLGNHTHREQGVSN
jgi:hypothetical protein